MMNRTTWESAFQQQLKAQLHITPEQVNFRFLDLYMIADHTVTFAKVMPQPVAEVAVVEELAASLQVPGATGVPKRQRKTSTAKTEAKPKQTRATPRKKVAAK